MEGMNANMPVVCTDVGDNSYLVEDGYNGFLAPIRDYVSLSDGILRLIKDGKLRATMGKNSKEHLLDDYSVEIFKERYKRLLKGFEL